MQHHTTPKQLVRQRRPTSKSRTSCKRRSMPWGKGWKSKLPEALWAYRTAYKTPIGMTPYQLVYGKTCIYQLNSSISLIGLLRGGTWISNQLESSDKSSWLNWMNGGRRPTIALNSTKSEQKDGMISVSRSNSSRRETRYSFSTPVFACLVMVNLEASGKAPS